MFICIHGTNTQKVNNDDNKKREKTKREKTKQKKEKTKKPEHPDSVDPMREPQAT